MHAKKIALEILTASTILVMLLVFAHYHNVAYESGTCRAFLLIDPLLHAS